MQSSKRVYEEEKQNKNQAWELETHQKQNHIWAAKYD